MALLAAKPPMGWNAWNYFGPGKINETVVRETADAMVEQGFRDAGYVYVSVDDCWMSVERDANGDLQADPVKFPSGMKALGDYIHERGLKFGLYAGAGVLTYAGRAGSYGYERQDARKFAEWGVDLLKYDFGYVAPGTNAPELFRRMGQALRESGREILFSGCLGRTSVTEWMRSTGASMWRLSGDITDQWSSIVNVAKNAMTVAPFSGPGGWNDPDMMVIGLDGEGWASGVGWMKEEDVCKGCTDNEYSAHFSLWCMLAAPLLMGHDVRKTRPELATILQNAELIAINQDEECRPPYLAGKSGEDQYFFIRHLSNNEFVLAYFNLSEAGHVYRYSASFADLGIPYESGCGLELTDVFTGENPGVKRDYFLPAVEPHGCRRYKAKLVKIK